MTIETYGVTLTVRIPVLMVEQIEALALARGYLRGKRPNLSRALTEIATVGLEALEQRNAVQTSEVEHGQSQP